MAIGRDAAVATGTVGWAPDYRRPALPAKATLEYAQTLITVALLVLALTVFVYYLAVAGPRKALAVAAGRVRP